LSANHLIDIGQHALCRVLDFSLGVLVGAYGFLWVLVGSRSKQRTKYRGLGRLEDREDEKFLVKSFCCDGSLAETAGELEDEVEEQEALKGTGVVKVPIDLDQGNVLLKVVPWIGGRIISMVHKPSGLQLHIYTAISL
jgi:hypothetical protein